MGPPSDDPRAFVVSAERLRAVSRLAGAALAITFAIPFETQHDGARFSWQLAFDLAPASTWTLAAPALAGAAVLVATFVCERAESLAIAMLAAVASVLLVTSAGEEALAWDGMIEPDLWRSGPAPGWLAVSLTAAAVCFAAAPAGRRVARRLFVAAGLAAIAHLALPARGEARLAMTVRVIRHVAARSGHGNLFGALIFALVVLWPLVAVGAGLVHARRTVTRARSLLAVLGGYAFPVILSPIVERSFVSPWSEGEGALATLGASTVSAAALVLLASGASVIASVQGMPATARASTRMRAVMAAGAAAVLAIGTWIAGRPSSRRPTLDFVAATPEGDRLFGELLPAWNERRASADLGDARAARPDVARAQAALIEAARDVDARLGDAMTALVSDEATRTERRWYRRVERANEAAWRARLPYYIDPTAIVGERDDPLRRWLRIDTYRIEAVHRFTYARGELATLLVRTASPTRARYSAMGLSRDLQPFAVVELDEIEAYARELDPLATRTPPRCGEGRAEDDAAEEALGACGETLAAVAREGDLRALLLATTERHELQHQIDGAYMPRSAWLEARLAWRDPGSRARIERELSAYLAQMTADGAAPRLTLVRLARMALLFRRGTEHEAARLAFEALGDADDPANGSQSTALESARLQRFGDAVLREKAKRAWKKVYGRELAAVRR